MASEFTFQIFRAGTHQAMGGELVTMNAERLKRIASAYEPSAKRAPLRIGHTQDPSAPKYGDVLGLAADGDDLYATANVSDALVNMVRDGHYKQRSASFCMPDSPANPKRGEFYLDHIAFLGAHPPALKGMAPLNFAEGREKDVSPLALDALYRSVVHFSESAAIRAVSSPLVADAIRRNLTAAGLRAGRIF